MKNIIVNKTNHKAISFEEYKKEYFKSISNPEDFWKEKANSISWIKKFTKTRESSFEKDISIKWFADGTLNVSFNCLDRHLKDRGNKTAIIWESDDPNISKKITYRELYEEVCKFSN